MGVPRSADEEGVVAREGEREPLLRAAQEREGDLLVLMSIELILTAVNINLVAFSAFRNNIAGQVFALFVIAVAAAEVGVGLAIVLLIYRNKQSIDLTDVDIMKG